MPAAPQLLGASACPTTGGSGAPTSSSRSTSTPARSTTSRRWPSRWDRRTTSSSAWRSRPGCWPTCRARTRRRTSSRSPRSPASAACAFAPSSPATGTTTTATTPTSSTFTSSRRAAAAHSCIRPTCSKNAISVRWPERPDEGESPSPDTTGRPAGRGLEGEAVRHPPQAQHQGGRGRRRAGGPGRAGRDGAAAEPDASRPKRKRQPLKPQAPKCYPEQEQQLPAEPRQRAVPVLQPRLRHRHRPALLAHHLAIPERSSRSTSISAARSTASASPPRSASVLPFMPLYLIQAMIASISLVVMLGGLYAALVWYVDAVDHPGPRRYLTKFFVGIGALPGAPHRHVHAVAAGRHAQQLDGAADREARRMPSTRSRKEQAPIVRDVIEELLEPLQRQQPRQREQRSSAPGGRSRGRRPFASSSASSPIRP